MQGLDGFHDASPLWRVTGTRLNRPVDPNDAV
jgi:hypothetical protein